ncbi:hypothetical protein N9150_01560 [Akkermansiaceae bacterium]|nr:hypothetical protein [Akkermansiaceae bacterium]
MAKKAEMDAKDIAILFRSFADAGLESWLSKRQDPTTFTEQDFDTQMGWFADQIEARVGEKSPSPDVLALMAALGGFMIKDNPNDGVDKAYEIWQAADKRIREEALCSREEIEENLSQVGVDFRLTP